MSLTPEALKLIEDMVIKSNVKEELKAVTLINCCVNLLLLGYCTVPELDVNEIDKLIPKKKKRR